MYLPRQLLDRDLVADAGQVSILVTRYWPG
jgi:hypothetical protein